ncbi:MAG: nicotinate-nucleotide adenylyltransferase [Candidatus Eisenbacteria bacterium]
MTRRLGLFGGTFDPPHLGHLALAEWARDALKLDRVLFMPAARPPHKSGPALSGVSLRLAMTRLAVAGHRGFEVSRIEAEREGPSFTVDTLKTLRARRPGARWFLLMGEDSLADLATWKQPGQIVRLATPVVAARPGAQARRSRLAFGRRVVWLDNPGIEVSSSAIRARARLGRSIRFLVPDAVAHYIERTGVYRERSTRPARRGAGRRPQLASAARGRQKA